MQDTPARSKRKFIIVGASEAVTTMIAALFMLNAGVQNATSAAANVISIDKTTSGSNCDASYPDVCVPPSPPDLDCKDIPYRNFKVLPPDPHRFDGDHDGVGCVS